MKEFIVWDDIDKKFYDNETNFYENDSENKCILLNGKVLIFVDEKYDSNVFYPYKEKDKLIPLWATELKDINHKKIYADCSIVEFDYFVGFWEYKKAIGVFFWDNERLKYRLNIIENNNAYGKVIWNFEPRENKNFKIIDTIQQNKLGLIK